MTEATELHLAPEESDVDTVLERLRAKTARRNPMGLVSPEAAKRSRGKRGQIYGSTEPRLWTPPLRRLTPRTSYGYDVDMFARRVLGRPLDPWQRWLAIHGGELLPDGRPRFRTVLVLVARQNGKTELCVVLTLFWLYVELVPLVLGTSTVLDYARESWEKAVTLAEGNLSLLADMPSDAVRRANGEQTLKIHREIVSDLGNELRKCRYKIAASNRKGGRSLTIFRLILDELREHHDWTAWDAAVPATNAVSTGQTWAISNQGDAKSVVLDSLRESALDHIEHGDGDERLGIFEWSAEDGSDPGDVVQIAKANPNLNARHGHGIELDAILGQAKRAKRKGGDQLAGYLTEVMCRRVRLLDPAIEVPDWEACYDPGVLSALRGRLALCLDVSQDGLHATLAAAAILEDKRARIEIIKAWDGRDCTRQLRRDLPELVKRIQPRKLGWFPSGPSAAVAAELTPAEGEDPEWLPSVTDIEPIRTEVTAVCMGYADMVKTHQVAQSEDPNRPSLLTTHTTTAEKLRVGDGWRFTRRGAGHCDAAYAAGGAIWLAQTMPPPAIAKVRFLER